jgi:transcriptional regulator with XRE-family HTH domain
MAKPKARPYSRIARHAATLLGRQIQIERKRRRMSAQQLAERAGISRGLVQRIEKGDPGCQIGAVFEAAAIVGVALFDADAAGLAGKLREAESDLALLPRHTHTRKTVDDEF